MGGAATDAGETPAVDLYLDLLARVLTRTLFDEALVPVEPAREWVQKAVGAVQQHVLDPRKLVLAKRVPLPEDRYDGRDHPPDAETMVGLTRLANLRRCVQSVVADGVPGDLLEAGVWRGGSVIFMQAALKALGVHDRRVWVCDSFQGLPPPKPDEFPADAGDTLWQLDHLAVGVEQVKRNFERYGLLDDNVVFLKGLFQDTFPTAPIGPLAVLRADGDMYESTMAVLTNLYDKVSPGGFVIIDDYGSIPACQQAVDEYRADHAISEPIETVDWTGVFWRKRS